MAEEGLVKKRRGTRRESMIDGWHSNNCIAPDHSPTQLISLFFDLAKSNLDKRTKVAWVNTCYKCVPQKVKPVPLSDGSASVAGLHWRE